MTIDLWYWWKYYLGAQQAYDLLQKYGQPKDVLASTAVRDSYLAHNERQRAEELEAKKLAIAITVVKAEL